MFRRRILFFRIARIMAMFVVGLLVAVSIALSQVNLETLRENILDVLRDSTGMMVEIDGDISWKFSLRPRVEINKIRIPNADWAKNKNGLMAEKIDIRLNLLSLLRDRPTIQSIKVHSASVYLEKNDKGKLSMNVNSDADNSDINKTAIESFAKYPFNDPALGSVEVRDITAYIIDTQYQISGFQINYKQIKDTREYSGWVKSKKKVFPFIISLSEFNNERKVYPVQIALSTGGEALVMNVALEGTSKMPIDFIVKGTIPDLASLGETLGLDLPSIPSIGLNLSGGFDRNKITLRKSSISVRGNDLSVSGSIKFGGKVPEATIKLASKRINLVEILPWLYAPGSKWKRPDRPLNVFKDISLYGTEFLKFNLDMTADIDNLIVYRDLTIKDIDIDFSLKNGVARADTKVKFAEGDVRANTQINIDPSGHINVRGAGIGERIYVGEIMTALNANDFISELPMNFEFYLEGNGENLSQLMSTVTGPIMIYSVAPGYAHSALVSYMYGTDFLTGLRHNIQDLFTTKKKYNQIKISCATLNLKVRNGVIDTENGIAVETNAINLRAAGEVNLGKEKIKASLITVPVRGIKISLSGNVLNSIEFSGQLAEPDIKINGAAVASKVVSATGIGLLLAPFTGGIGLVAGAGVGWLAGDLIENWLADDHPCRTARNKGAPSKKGDPEWLNSKMAQLVGSLIK